jgi:CheY-like chemotaxis protein
MRHILIVDDDRAIRELMRAWLELEGFDAAAAADGDEAVALLRASAEPWVVLMDVMMPHLSGTEACRQLDAHCPGRHRVVLMTAGYADEVDAPASVRAILRKPFDMDELVELVRALAADPAPYALPAPERPAALTAA